MVNHEEQYSIWPAGRDLPSGWRAEGTSGGRDECLAHIERVWTDLRPLSAREPSSPGRRAGDPAADASEGTPHA